MKRGGASKQRRLILLLFVGWVPPYLPPSGACLHLGPSLPGRSLNAAEGLATGAPSLFIPIGPPSPFGCSEAMLAQAVWRNLHGQRDLLGNGPHKADQLPGDGHGHDMRVFALGPQALVAFAEPDLRLPTDVLHAFGLVFETQLQLAADLSRDSGMPTRLRRARVAHGCCQFWSWLLADAVGRGMFGRHQTQEFHQSAGGLKPC